MNGHSALASTAMFVALIATSFARDAHSASADTAIWQQLPVYAPIEACDISASTCPRPPAQVAGVWVNGVVVNEFLSNQGDPHGIGSYELRMTYDPIVFQPPTIADQGTLNDNGVRGTACQVISSTPGDVLFGCFSTGPFGIGATWTNARIIAAATFTLQPDLFQQLVRPNVPPVSTTVRAAVQVTNTCGQPLNDGTIQPVNGSNDCQGNLLDGVGPGGIIANVNPSTFDVSISEAAHSLAADVNGDCVVNMLDLGVLGGSFLAGLGSSNYSANYDLNDDGVVNLLDLAVAGVEFGKRC